MSVPYYGDFAEDDTVLIPFNTFSSDDPSASVTMTTLIDSDIKVHKDGSTDEIATDGASVAINFDSRTGAHLITIDTSADAAYSTGSEYAVMIEGATVDGGNVTAWVGSFSIERAGGVLALIKATLDVNVTSLAADVITPASVDEDADFVIQALSITNALDAGSVLVDGTTTLTGNVSCGAGFDVVGALSANSILVDTTTTLTGNVSCGAGFDVVGALSANTLLIDSTTTLTGAVSCGATFDVVGELSANSVLVDVGTVLTGAVTTGAITADALSVTNQLDAGNLLVDGTTVLTGTVGTGAATLASLSVTGQLDAGNVVVDAGMDIVGALSANSLLIDTTATVTGNALITGTTTHTGAVTLTGGINAGAVSGTLAADLITASSLKADAVTKIIDDFETQSQADPTGFHVNLKEINGTAVAGDGGGTPWGP